MKSHGLTEEERELLKRSAMEVALKAYAPYSGFRVGAAVIGERLHCGVNVENACYNLGLCAERSALSTAISQGETKIRGIAIACVDAQPATNLQECMPCGACRQWIKELAPEAEIIICGTEHLFTIDQLLPIAFTLRAGAQE